MKKDTSWGADGNPHVFWKNPVQWFRWRRIQLLHRDYAATRIDLNEFEKGVLIPELRSRAEFMLECFTEMQRICKDPAAASYLVPALRSLLQDADGAPPAENVAIEYLTGTFDIIENSFLVPLRRIRSVHASIDSMSALMRFLNDFRVVCSSITAAENLLFRYRLMARPYVQEKPSGKVVVGEPKEYDVVMLVFKFSIEELKRTADASEKTIDHWRQQLDAAKKPFLEFLAASTNAATSRRTILIQMLAIGLSLSLSTFFLTARDPFSLSRANAALKAELQEARDSANKQMLEVERLKGELRTMQQSNRMVPQKSP